MKILVIALILVVLLMGGGMGFLFLKMNEAPDPVVAEPSEGVPEPVEVAETRDAIYTSLNPAFLITYSTASGSRYLQVELQIMSYDLEVINEVDTNRPALRNNIIMLLSDQEFGLLESNEGRERLRTMIKDVVQGSLRTLLPVEEIYFNSFVVQ